MVQWYMVTRKQQTKVDEHEDWVAWQEQRPSEGQRGGPGRLCSDVLVKV